MRPSRRGCGSRVRGPGAARGGRSRRAWPPRVRRRGLEPDIALNADGLASPRAKTRSLSRVRLTRGMFGLPACEDAVPSGMIDE